MEPTWENTETKVNGDDVRVVRSGHIDLSENMAFEAIDPETFMRVNVRSRVPVQQAFIARGCFPSILTPLVVDFQKLRRGDYDWDSVILEDIK